MILATHPNPHLDDICGIWLLKKYDHRFNGARIRYIPQGTKINDESVVAIGIGRGKYDEHKGDVLESATTLVFKDVRSKIKNTLERAAVAELVQWVCDEDHARFMGTPYHEFGVGSVIMELPHLPNISSAAATEWGMKALDALLQILIEKQKLLRDWKKRKEFLSQWGRGVALTTTASSGQVGEYATSQGILIFVAVNSKNKFRYIKAAPGKIDVDLTAAYDIVRHKEPNVDWYLHHSKRMLICGSDVAPQSKLSKMSLAELVALIEKK